MADSETVKPTKALVAEMKEADDRKWQTLVDSGGRRAEALGLTEDDIPRLVSEARRDRQTR